MAKFNIYTLNSRKPPFWTNFAWI